MDLLGGGWTATRKAK